MGPVEIRPKAPHLMLLASLAPPYIASSADQSRPISTDCDLVSIFSRLIVLHVSKLSCFIALDEVIAYSALQYFN